MKKMKKKIYRNSSKAKLFHKYSDLKISRINLFLVYLKKKIKIKLLINKNEVIESRESGNSPPDNQVNNNFRRF